MRRALVVAAGFVLLAALLPAAQAQGPASDITHTYQIRTRGDIGADMTEFAAVAASTFDDPRGWSLGGSIAYARDESGAETSFTLWMADSSQMESFSSTCSPRWSCRVGDNVIINEDRWERGAPEWPLALHEYRHYLLIHELGHWLRLDHDNCPAAGEPAPVMMQESKGTEGCLARVWPLPRERARAGRVHGVPVRFDDGFADLGWYEEWKDHSVTVATSNGGSFDYRGEWISGYGNPDLAFLADVTGDGRADLIWYEQWKDRSVTVARSDGDRFTHLGAWISDVPDPMWAGVGDANADGLTDLVWYRGGDVQVALSRGDSFEPLRTWISGWGVPDWAGLGDVDRDGDADLLWYEQWKDGSVTAALSRGDGFDYGGEWISGWGPPDVAGAADANGDNRVDLLWYEQWNDASVTVATSNAERFVYRGKWISGWGVPDRAGFDDVTGDARADLLWYESWKDGSVTVGVSVGDRFDYRAEWISGWGAPDEALFGAAN